MKKIISFLLSTVILITGVMCVDFSALADDHMDSYNFDIQDFFDNYQNKADDFNYLQYISQHYTSDGIKNTIEFRINQDTNCNNLVGYLNSNLWFQGSYAIWETATFVTNPVDTIEKQLNKETYYETIILRILNSSVTSDNAIDWLNQGAIKNSIKISKNITQASETEYYAYLANKHLSISDFTDEEYNKTIEFTKNYINSQNYKKFGKDVSFIYDVLSMSKDIEEYSERLASYCQLIELGDSVADFLDEIKNNSDNNDLIKAIDNVVPIIRDSHSDMLKTAAKDGLYCIGSFALKKIVGETWKNCLINLLNNGYLFDGTAIVGSVFLAIGITKTFANIAFSTDAKLDKYELMKALCSFEQSMEVALHRKINTFEDTDEYANILLEGVSIVYQTYIIDTEVYSEMTRICQNDWIGNLSRDEYEKIIDICNYNKELYQNEYDSLKIVSGICGDTLGWVITFDKELLIYGIGEMYDFEKEKAPWYDYKNRFNNLHVSKLITVLGGYAFYNCDNIISDICLDHNVTIRWNCFDNILTNITIVSKEDLIIYGCQNINYMITCNGNMKVSVLADDDFIINNIVKVIGNLTCTFEHIYHDNCVTNKTVKLVVNSKLLVSGNCNLKTDNRGHIISSTIYGDFIINPDGEVIIDNSLTMNGYGDSENNYYTKTIMRIYVKGNLIVKKDINTYSYSKFYMDNENCKVIVKNDFYNTGTVYAMEGEISIYGTPKGMSYCRNGNANWYLYGNKIERISSLVIGGEEYGNGSVTLCGYAEQSVNGIYVDNLIITNNAGVNFTYTVTVYGLFNHNRNSFLLFNNGEGSSFSDYDGDGYKDNIDPYPLVKEIDEHKYDYTKTIPPTCTTQGYDIYTCSICGTIQIFNTVSSNGHNYEITNNTATCLEKGIETSVCLECGSVRETELSALGHSYNIVYTAPTCIESGGYTNTCIRCGDALYNIYEKNGHDYGECIGEDYINTIYTTEGKFIESISSSANYYGKTYYTTSPIGKSSIRKLKVTYPQQIRIDKNNPDIIENYKFKISRYSISVNANNLNYAFVYDQSTGRSPDQSAIPYTDKNGNLINMKYVDYKDNGEWNNGEYLIDNNNIVDINGSVVSSSFSETRPHIVYTKEEALESGIMNNDGTVNVNYLFDNEISFSSGVDGIYTTIFNASVNNYVSALKCDDNVKLNAGVYNVPLCFYSSGSYATGNLLLKIYDTDNTIKKTPATETTDEIIEYTCMDCGEEHIETSSLDISNFKIKTISLSLASSITMNFKVLKTAVADFENPCVQFTRNGSTITVSKYTEQGDYLVFAYKDIAPQAMNDTVTAVLKAEHNTIEYSSSPLVYSVSKYVYTMLDKCSDDQYAKLRTLLVDLLNYGAEAQSYQNYKTDELVNSKLTDTQKAWASTDELALADVTDKNYSTVENALVEWKSASLQLNNSVAVRYKFTAQSVDNLSVKVECGASQWEYGADSFTDNGDGTYYFLFNDLNADKMSEDIFITVMNGDTAVSNTMRFSVESYSKKVQDLMPNSSLQKLTDAMMRYGRAAANYA